MDATTIRFDDGAEYEEFMGKWSQLAGDSFLNWLSPPDGGRWLDVGCGNGAFTEMLVQRCAPIEVHGVDPSEAQLAYARTRLGSPSVQFQLAGATSLPFANAVFDAAVMALVIFFVPDPSNGVAEMVRVTRPGGIVSAYAWDFLGGGFPFAALQQEMALLGSPPLWPPSVEAGRIDVLRELWLGAGLVDVQTCAIDVERTFPDFDTFWAIAKTGPRVAARIAAMPDSDSTLLKERVRDRLPPSADRRITYGAYANAVKGRVPT